MALLLILGAVACLYLVWLLITCTLHALPLGVAIGTGFCLHAHGAGIALAILGALAAGVALAVAGSQVFARARSPVTGLSVMLLFTIPAGVASHQFVHGLGRLLPFNGAVLSWLAIIGGVVVASVAGRRLALASGRMINPAR
ncbi:MAG: hypothetical protein I8H86_10285 [Sphingomonadaceae bacterium]|nr:hypothetical protein [Sphingomonadaceae bacterium]